VAALTRYAWPGNVRELEKLIERLVIISLEETIDARELRAQAPAVFEDASPIAASMSRLVTLRQLEDEYIAWVIKQCDGNKKRAAAILDIDASTIHRRGRAASSGAAPPGGADPTGAPSGAK